MEDIMRFNSSCAGISFWEDLCKAGLKSGKVTVAHDGKSENNNSCYTRKYNIHLKSTIYPAEVRFIYDNRENTDKASAKIALSDLVLILQAFINKEFSLDTDKFTVSMDKESGLTISEK